MDCLDRFHVPSVNCRRVCVQSRAAAEQQISCTVDELSSCLCLI